MTRAEVAAEALCESGYVDEAKYAELVRLMDVFFKDVAREAKECEREECAKVADDEIAFSDSVLEIPISEKRTHGFQCRKSAALGIAEAIRSRGTK